MPMAFDASNQHPFAGRHVGGRVVAAGVVSAALLTVGAAGTQAAVVSNTDDVMQPGFRYDSGSSGASFDGGITLSRLRMVMSTQTPRPAVGTVVSGDLDGDGLLDVTTSAGSGVFAAPFKAQWRVRRDGPSTSRPTMDFALDELDFAALPIGVMLRESPTLLSTGQTRITELPDGRFAIESFFDIFTEISVDNGRSWLPASGSVRVELVPTPGVAALLGLGALRAAKRRR